MSPTIKAPSASAGLVVGVEPFDGVVVRARGAVVAGAVVVGACADEREHPLRVRDGDGAVAELLEELVGDRARGALG